MTNQVHVRRGGIAIWLLVAGFCRPSLLAGVGGRRAASLLLGAFVFSPGIFSSVSPATPCDPIDKQRCFHT